MSAPHVTLMEFVSDVLVSTPVARLKSLFYQLSFSFSPQQVKLTTFCAVVPLCFLTVYLGCVHSSRIFPYGFSPPFAPQWPNGGMAASSVDTEDNSVMHKIYFERQRSVGMNFSWCLISDPSWI